MGKLAEWLADLQRSGVYRVETTEAIEEAAALRKLGLPEVTTRGIESGNAMKLLPRLKA